MADVVCVVKGYSYVNVDLLMVICNGGIWDVLIFYGRCGVFCQAKL